MGFFEDDRIRSKNKINNQAYQLYQNLKSEGMSDVEVAQYATEMSQNNGNLNRDDIYLTVLKIVGSLNVSTNTDKHIKHSG